MHAYGQGDWLLELPFTTDETHNYSVKVSLVPVTNMAEPDNANNRPVITQSTKVATYLTPGDVDVFTLEVTQPSFVAIQSKDNCDDYAEMDLYSGSNYQWPEESAWGASYELTTGTYTIEVSASDYDTADCVIGLDIRMGEKKWKTLITADSGLNIGNPGVASIDPMTSASIVLMSATTNDRTPVGYQLNDGEVFPIPHGQTTYNGTSFFGGLNGYVGSIDLNVDSVHVNVVAAAPTMKKFQLAWVGGTGKVYQANASGYVERKSGDLFDVNGLLYFSIPTGKLVSDITVNGTSEYYGNDGSAVYIDLKNYSENDVISIELASDETHHLQVGLLPTDVTLEMWDGSQWTVVDTTVGITMPSTAGVSLRAQKSGVPIMLEYYLIDDTDTTLFSSEYFSDGWHLILRDTSYQKLLVTVDSWQDDPSLLHISGPGQLIATTSGVYQPIILRDTTVYWFAPDQALYSFQPDQGAYLETGDVTAIIFDSWEIEEGKTYDITFAELSQSGWEGRVPVGGELVVRDRNVERMRLQGSHVFLNLPTAGHWQLESVRLNGTRETLWQANVQAGSHTVSLLKTLPLGTKLRLFRK